MLSDIEIAQGCQMKPIREVAAKIGLTEDDLTKLKNSQL